MILLDYSMILKVFSTKVAHMMDHSILLNKSAFRAKISCDRVSDSVPSWPSCFLQDCVIAAEDGCRILPVCR